MNSYMFSKKIRTRHKLSIISSLNEDLSLDMNSQAALKHLLGGTQSRQNLNFLRTFGHSLVAS